MLFKIRDRNTSIKKEIIGGLVTFLAMAYVLAVNPTLLSLAGMPQGGVFIATALAAALATILMGLFANYPIALGPGMGLNALFAITICNQMGFSWQQGLVISFVASIIFIILSITPIRLKIIDAIPNSLKTAIGIGIGFFIAFVGLKNAGIIVSNDVIIGLGDLSNPTVLLGLFGIVLAIVLFNIKAKIGKFAFIISIIATALIGIILELSLFPGILGVGNKTGIDAIISTTSERAYGEFAEVFGGFVGGFNSLFDNGNFYFAVFSILFINIFVTTGTIVSVARGANLEVDGKITDIKKILIADSSAMLLGSVIGTSPITSFVESSSGVEAGARTGLASVVTGVLLLITIVMYPVFSIFINSYALTSMALVLIGIIMAASLKDIDWQDRAVSISTFITIIMMVLTFSIGDGIAFGAISYILVMLAQKRHKEVSVIMYILGVVFIVYLVLGAVM